MIRLCDLYRVIGRRLSRKLLDRGWLVPERSDSRGFVFDDRKVHHALSRLARESSALAPLWRPLAIESKQSKRKSVALSEIRVDEEDFAARGIASDQGDTAETQNPI